MIFPTDAFELVKARPELSGGEVPSATRGGRFYTPVKQHYDVPEADWPKLELPAIVWVPGRDRFNAPDRMRSVVVFEGQEVVLEPIHRCEAGHEIHFLVARTSDLQCRRDLYKLVSRFLVAARYALQTTANYSVGDGRIVKAPRMPAALHYVLEITPYVPVLDEPGALSTVDTVVVSATSVED